MKIPQKALVTFWMNLSLHTLKYQEQQWSSCHADLLLFFIFFRGFLKAPDSSAAFERSSGIDGCARFQDWEYQRCCLPRQERRGLGLMSGVFHGERGRESDQPQHRPLTAPPPPTPRTQSRPWTEMSTMTLRARHPRLVLERKRHALRALRPQPPPPLPPPLPKSIMYGHESPVHAQGHTALVIYVSEMYLIRYFSEFDAAAGTRIIQVKWLAQGHLNHGRLDYSLLVVLGFGFFSH